MGSTLVRGTILGLVLALLLNFLIFFSGNQLGVPFQVTQPTPQTITAMPIIIATLVPAIAAGILLWLLTKATQQPATPFLWIAIIVALLSLIPVYTGTRDIGSFAMLGLMHVASALAIAFSLVIFYQRCEAC